MATVCEILEKLEGKIEALRRLLASIGLNEQSGSNVKLRGSTWEVSGDMIAVWNPTTTRPLVWSDGQWARLRAGKIEARGDAFDFRSSDTAARIIFDVEGLKIYEDTGLMVWFNENGINIEQGTGPPNRIKYMCEGSEVAYLTAHRVTAEESVGAFAISGCPGYTGATAVIRANAYNASSVWIELTGRVDPANQQIRFWLDDAVAFRMRPTLSKAEYDFEVAGILTANLDGGVW